MKEKRISIKVEYGNIFFVNEDTQETIYYFMQVQQNYEVRIFLQW